MKFWSLFLLCCGDLLAFQDGDMVEVGAKPIFLKFRAPDQEYSAASYIGTHNNFIGKGESGKVYRLANGNAVKIMPATFSSLGINSDEIHVSQIAAKFDIGPKYFDAWVTEKYRVLYVIIEMEELRGGTLLDDIPESIISSKNRNESALRILQYRYGNQVVAFFRSLLYHAKILADNKCSYKDLTFRNLIHSKPDSWQHLKLIDFGGSSLHKSKAEAAKVTLDAIKCWVEMFESLPEKGEVATDALKYLREPKED